MYTVAVSGIVLAVFIDDTTADWSSSMNSDFGLFSE